MGIGWKLGGVAVAAIAAAVAGLAVLELPRGWADDQSIAWDD